MPTFTPVFRDLVRVSTTTQGTGPLVCGPAVPGFSSFADSVSVGDSFYYAVQNLDRPQEREIGRGTLQANGTIARQPVQGALTNFTSGSKTIALVTTSEWFTQVQGAIGQGAQGGQSLEVNDRALLKAADPTKARSRQLLEAGRQGVFIWNAAVPPAAHQADIAEGIFVAPNSASSGAWVRQFSGSVNVRWFGAVADGVTDDSAAFVAAIAYLKSQAVNNNGNTYKGSNRLRVPAGNYYMGTTTLDITHTLIIEGEGVGMAGGFSTLLKWGAGCTGIRLQRYNTEGDHQISAQPHFAADGTIIRGLRLQGEIGAGTGNFHGIDALARCSIQDCSISNWAGNGVNMVASAGAGAGGEGNANCFDIQRCIASFCKNGFFFTGADANAGLIAQCDATANREWGFDDSSFLGNTFVGCHAASNGVFGVSGGPFRTTNGNASAVFDGCYSEQGQQPSSFAEPTLVIGGTHGADFRGGYALAGGTSGIKLRTNQPFVVTNHPGGASGAFIVSRADNGYGALLAGDGGQFKGQPGYLFLTAAGSGVVRHQVENVGTVMEMDGNGLNFAAGKSITLGGSTVKGFLTMTQAAYDALATKDPNTFYFIS